MPVNPTNFLLSLASAMAANVLPASPAVVLGTDLFIHQSAEAFASKTHAALRIYGGPPPEEMWRIDKISIQLAAHSKSVSDAHRLAWQLYESLHTPAGDPPADPSDVRPRYNWTIDGKTTDANGALIDDVTDWQVYLITLAAPPGLVGVDDRGMQQVSFNFDARFAAAPVS